MRVMVVSPHPDDETLGAGGTILRYKYLGDEIFWFNFTDMKVEYGYSENIVDERRKVLEQQNKLYKFNDFFNLQLKPACLSDYPQKELVELSAEIIKKVQPNIIFIPFKNDAHFDHRITFEVIYSCSKIFRYHSIKKVLMMEILSETDFAASDCGFVPNYFIDISDFLETKLQIMNLYQSEIGAHPFPRSLENIEALAKVRGATAGCKYAESFILLKGIE